MAIAFSQEWAGAQPGPEMYDAVSAKMDIHNDPPEGLIVHTAGIDPDGVWRIFDVWESREAAERFERERLRPALSEVMPEGTEPPPPPKEVSYELHDLLRP
jgi:hypothetical protein